MTEPCHDCPIVRSDRNGCAVLTLNRPHKLNAIDHMLLELLETELQRLEADDTRAFVIIGQGRAFCAGGDLSQVDSDLVGRVRRMHRLAVRLQSHPKPSVAALNGTTLGGGLELAAACTLRIAAPGIRLGLPEVKLGVMPMYGGTALLPPLIGTARSLELMLTGEPISSEQAERWGLVNRISHDPGTLADEAVALAMSVGRHSRVAVTAMRRTHAAAAHHSSLQDALAVELSVGREVMDSVDAREGIAAFQERRKPVFRDC
jgi:enoyl-CoA hydratase